MRRLGFLLGGLVGGAALAVPVDPRPEALRRFGGAAGTVVVAVSPTCPCSRSHEPVLERLAERYDPFGFVGLRSAEAPSAEYFGRRALPFPVVAAPGVARALSALKTPHVFAFERTGQLRYRGGVDDSLDAERATKPYLADAPEALSKGRAPTVVETRPLGCRVDWE
jgi:hypothetical protein